MDPFLIIMVVGMLALMFFTQSRARKNAAAQNQFRTSLQPGQRVMTQGGLVGTIVSINDADDTVIIQSADSTCEYKRAGLAKTLDPVATAAGAPALGGLGGGLAGLAGAGLAGTGFGGTGLTGGGSITPGTTATASGGPIGAGQATVAPAYGAMIDDAVPQAYEATEANEPIVGTTVVLEGEPGELDDFAILDSITNEYLQSQGTADSAG